MALNIVTAADSKIAIDIANCIEEKAKKLNYLIIRCLFKQLKKLNEINDHSIFIFIVSSYFHGTKCRSIRRFQRKLDQYKTNLNISYCIISLHDAKNESIKMNETLIKQKLFCHFNKI